MADDVTLPGTGAVVATDDVGGRQFQLVKLAVGGDGVADGVDDAHPIPVAQQGPIALDSATLAALESINATTGGLTDAQLRATAVPVTGPLTDAQLRAAPFETTHTAPPFVRIGFAEVGAGLVGNAASQLSLLQTGAGQTVNQTAGNLVITTGTTTNAETIIRSQSTFTGSLLARVKVILSQRIVNQTFRFELADLVGEGLTYTINSTTSVTVTFGSGLNPFTSINVGQSVRLSRLSSVGIPGRFAIASVSDDSVNFTVAGWPASGGGTLTLYGWNAIWTEYSGTTATNVLFDAARRGWASGNTTATINTTASPGHVAQLGFDVFTAGLSDALVASNTGYQWTTRASRVENLPDPDVPMYLFIVVQNGSTAPASTTTLTVGFVQVEDQGRQKVRIASADPTGSHALPVYQVGGIATATQAVSGTVTANWGTLTTPTASILNSAASTNGTVVKASAGTLYSITASNTNAAVRYLKIHNSTTVTVGTTAVALTIPIPAGGTVTVPFGALGMRFGTGICISTTTGAGDTDTGAVAAGEIKVLTSFI